MSDGSLAALKNFKPLLDYNPDTGLFLWLDDRNHCVKVGSEAGCKDSDGYIVIRINYKRYRAGRLAWLYMTGEWPEYQIDHINRNRLDNRWENLRLATPVQNLANQNLRSTNKSGYKGVHWRRASKAYQATIKYHEQQISLGYFDNPTNAAIAYNKAALKYFGEFAYLNEISE